MSDHAEPVGVDEDDALPPFQPVQLTPPSSSAQAVHRNRSNKKSVFNVLKTHLTVVKAAITVGHGGHKPSSGGTSGGGRSKTHQSGGPILKRDGSTVKGGELYAWDASLEDTPNKTNVRSAAKGAGGLGPHLSLQTSAPPPRLPPRAKSPDVLEGSERFTAAAAVGIGTMTLSPPAPSTAQKRQQFYMANEQEDNSSLGRSPQHQREQKTPGSSWSWSEQFFFSQDDESVSSSAGNNGSGDGGDAVRPAASFHSLRSVPPVNKFDPIHEAFGDGAGDGDGDGDDGTDDETCNNTIVEKVRQRSKKASRASTVGAFVTFLKALFGIGMLSNPAVLGEVGLILGTFCHLFIVVGCAFSCYLLLTARRMAKAEVMAKQRRDAEKREEYEMWRAEMERRAAQRAGRSLPVQGAGRISFTAAATLPRGAGRRMDLGAFELDDSGRSLLANGSTNGSTRTLQTNNAGGDDHSVNAEDWTVAPVPVPLNVPLQRVGTSMIPKQGWVRCEDALSNSLGKSRHRGRVRAAAGSGWRRGSMPEGGSNTLTQSCGNVQMIKQPKQPAGERTDHEAPALDPLSSSEASRKRSNVTPGGRGLSPARSWSAPQAQAPQAQAPVSDEYQRFSDKAHTLRASALPLLEPPRPPDRSAPRVRLVTYGDVAKYLAGKRAAGFIIFTIVTVHLMFASGMVHLAVENLCYVVGWDRLGWSYVEEYEYDRRHLLGQLLRRLGPGDDESSQSQSNDEEEYYMEWKGPDFIGRIAMASLLFPIIQGLLQIPSLTELATISSIGLITYACGCIGSMIYTAVILTDGHPFGDRPDDMWGANWSGIPTYVATTIYCIEGINLALPTVGTIEGTQRWGGVALWQKELNQSGNVNNVNARKKEDLSVFIVVGAVFLYGMVTLVVSWLGLAGGLGGGIGTTHGEDGCWDVTYCLNSSAVRFVYMLSLGVALVLTLPVILYPSTEMLEVWLDERNDERRRRVEEAAEAAALSRRGQEVQAREPFWQGKKSLLPDDETIVTVSDTLSPRLGIRGGDIEMRDLNCSPVSDGGVSGVKRGYVAPSCSVNSPISEPSCQHGNETPQMAGSPAANPNMTAQIDPEKTKLKARRKLKYWKLRMFLAFIICVIGTIEGSSPSAVKVAEVIRGVGLSIAGLIFPPLLYMSAVGGNFSAPMAAAMALLIGLGFFNIVLVLMSAFGSRDYIVEEGRGNFYEM